MNDDNAKQKLSIETATITIKVLKVGGHKMTKATFNQIPYRSTESWPCHENVLGWVSCDDKKYILYTEFGVLFRSYWGKSVYYKDQLYLEG